MSSCQIPISRVRFKLGDRIRHIKTKNVYHVINTPSLNHLMKFGEEWEMFYVYTSEVETDMRLYYRAQTQMEDGRFEHA